MWKAIESEALIDGMIGASMGGPETLVAELAIMGLIIGAKKLTHRHRQQQQAQRIDDQRRADEEIQRQADEQARIRLEEEQKQQALEEEARRQEEEAKQQQQQLHDENEAYIQQSVDAEYDEVQNVEYEREQRIEQMLDEDQDYLEYVGNQSTPEWRMPDNDPDNPSGNNNNNGGGGNGGGGNGGGGNDYIILDPAGQPARNQYQNPFWELIGKMSATIAQNALMQKQHDEEEQKKIIDDLPVNPTDQEKLEKDIADQAHTDADQITDNQAIIQQQLLDVLTGLGEEELTLEESLVELDRIENDLNKLIGSQVKTTQIYSSSIKTF